ncbi:D-ribose pyranase [Guptibacillus algicola]|uniref:D-ribose pyranase n=1 Tax=Guptibacillus algicola TaxID=225844 RepID=UPI001CD3912A|nr:D-ribose pyranase [Alkalihalobacillus algicola]MCA0986532.1 D-ribose pyranase [Alkalihalobacillus algicola]
MKRKGMLNSHITKLLADLGHTDTIVVADAGLPVPDDVEKIDLSLKEGVPSFLDVVQVMKGEMVVEKVTLADEVKRNQHVYSEMSSLFEAIEYTSHESLKEQTYKAKAVIRTGEVTPFANCILHAGVIF